LKDKQNIIDETGLPKEKRLNSQIAFLLELDKLKSVFRRSYIQGGLRRENDAEHSWHLALAALILAEHADEPVDILRVIQMGLIHDLVEIDAGDTFLYDEEGMEDKAGREQCAADRIFGLLPGEQSGRLRALWEEFEARQSAEARFAAALDRLLPLMHNYFSEGKTWREHDVQSDQVYAMNNRIGEASGTLWDYARILIQDAEEKGFVSKSSSTGNSPSAG
jgi:putative hydrolase of HD superfamily